MLNMDKTTTGQKNPKNKKLIVGAIIGAFVLAGGAAAFLSEDEAVQKTDVNVVATKENTGKPIQSSDENYTEAVKESNATAASEAMVTNGSHIDVITNKVVEKPVNDSEFLHENPNNNNQLQNNAMTEVNQQQPQTIIQERINHAILQ